jgi:hypothetical protein
MTIYRMDDTGAWLWVFADTRRTGRRPARSTLTMMAIATAALGTAAVWPTLEPHLIAILKELFR